MSELHFHCFPLVLDGVEEIRILSFCGRGGSRGSGEWISLKPLNSPSASSPAKAGQSYLCFSGFPRSHAEAMGIDGLDVEWQVIYSLPRFSLHQSHMGGNELEIRVRQVSEEPTSGNRMVKSMGIILERVCRNGLSVLFEIFPSIFSRFIYSFMLPKLCCYLKNISLETLSIPKERPRIRGLPRSIQPVNFGSMVPFKTLC